MGNKQKFEQRQNDKIQASTERKKVTPYLRMISDPTLHGPTCIVMLHSEANERHETPVVLGDRALHLIKQQPSKTDQSF
jgi:hypothetical protein